MIPVLPSVPKNFLFVCTGNACRSVMAEAMLQSMINARKIEGMIIRSCGTNANPAYRVPPVVLRLLADKEIDVNRHVSTQMNGVLAAEADLILIMDESHRQFIRTCFPVADGKAFLLKEFAAEKKPYEIFDPIGQSDEVYERTAAVIERCLKKIIKKIMSK